MKSLYKTITAICITALTVSISSCEEELTTNSSTSVTSDVLFGTTDGLNKLLNSAYTTVLFGYLTEGGQAVATYVGIPGFNLYYDIPGQDIVVTINYGMAPEDGYQFKPNRTNASQDGRRIWGMMYLVINQTNAILDALSAADGSAADKNAIEGQCLALRGICYFHLMLNYQQTYAVAKDKRGVILRTSGKQPMDLGFSTVQQCYDQIVKDLSSAKTKLASFNRNGKWQVNADVASGYLARVYQVMGNWDGALAEASAVYSKYSTLMTEAEWCGGQADITIPEIIWAVENTNLSNNGENTQFAYWHNQDPSYGEGMSDGPIYNFLAMFVDQKYVDLFDATDYRGTKCTKTTGVTDEDEKSVMFWHRTNAGQVGWPAKWAYNKFKYYGDDGKGTKGQRNLADYSILRSAEMLLIKAEAEANLGQTTALATLQTLQTARNAQLTTTTVKADLLEAIYIERRKELLGEGVTGMYDNVRLQKELVRYAGASGHFAHGLTNLDVIVENVEARLPSNDYRYFCQIPEIEFANNKAIDQKDQNPPRGQ
ncbi:MAG: RagB/SusD family nutrient uptake outer membrane protein [Bacteroidales bacterium]|jgi:hypothetical protein|nr:RagB/SusD family nutrient uptake outer membrane protein [Bacteroidales bacterium]